MSRMLGAHWKMVAAVSMAVGAGLILSQVMPSRAVAGMTAAPSHGEATAGIKDGDSRLNNYRLERDSCCVGEEPIS